MELESWADGHAYLPGLELDAPPEPAMLLALFDRGGGASMAANGRTSLEARIFLEVLMGHPPPERDGRLKETAYTLKEITGEWLGWDSRNYRRNGSTTGAALRAALARVRDIAVPMNDRGGFYYPVMVSAGQGWGLDDKLAFVTRLPDSQVGPQVNRLVLRSLARHGPAYRLYLSLCFEWDRHGGRGGKLIRPTRPEVLRAPGGQILDAKGEIITGRGGKPVYTPHDPRAIATGRREPNPARARYPEYSADEAGSDGLPGQRLG